MIGDLRQQTIQRRLAFAITLSVLLGMLIVGTVLVPLASSRRLDIVQTDLVATARILAHNLQASVRFSDPEDATKQIASLHAKPSIVSAWILEDGAVYAKYGAVEAPPGVDSGLVDGQLLFKVDIAYANGAYYTLVLADDFSGYRAGFWLDVLTLAGAILCSIAVLLVLTGRLARRISQPLSELAEHARRLSADETYEARVATDQGAEIATLFTAFNDLMTRIRERDKALLEAQARAEARAEEAERAREDLAISLHSIADAFLACDARGVITRMNPVAEHLTGWSAGLAVGRPIEEVYRVRDLQTDAELQPAARAVLGLRGEMAGNAAALLVARDGNTTPVADHAAPILDREGLVVGAVLVARDMREQFELEERLRQGQKMEAIGQLAGGVAHDFNNLLTGILGYVDLIGQRLGDQDDVRDDLRGIRQAAERAADLTGQLLAFARRGRLQREAVDVHDLLRATIGILQHTVGPKIALRTELHAEHRFVFGDASQLQSAFLNLGVNARDAMPGGGVLTFRTDDLVDETDAGTPGARRLRVQVVDTGVGIEAHLLEKIFEPFFTTKKVGEGTGLGLAAVYGTMQSHGGEVGVSSEPGKGTTFSCVLPVHAGASAAGEAGPVAPAAEKSSGGRRLVLVADDEEMLRRVATNMLQRLGCDVLLAEHGARAVELFERHHGELAMVLMDVHMPELDGTDAYARMRKIDPTVPILMTTGSSIDRCSFPGAAAENFMQKPYTFACLSMAIERLVEVRT